MNVKIFNRLFNIDNYSLSNLMMSKDYMKKAISYF